MNLPAADGDEDDDGNDAIMSYYLFPLRLPEFTQFPSYINITCVHRFGAHFISFRGMYARVRHGLSVIDKRTVGALSRWHYLVAPC